jgi:hypothetical protein
MGREKGPARPKIAKIEIVPRGQDKKAANYDSLGDEAYNILYELAAHQHPLLRDARIALAWLRGVKPDKDGHIKLGKCYKAADVHRQLHNFDFVIGLNREAMGLFNPRQRRALIDHELCHAAPQVDKEGDQKRDALDRPLWRIRKHDIEEFLAVVQRNGCWKSDLDAFYTTLRDQFKEPLLAAGRKKTRGNGSKTVPADNDRDGEAA